MKSILIIDDSKFQSECLSIARDRSIKFSKLNESELDIKFIRAYENTFDLAMEEFNRDGIYYDYLLLDHDLGSDFVANDGTKLIRFVYNMAGQNNYRMFGDIICISNNPVGRKRIETTVESIEKFLKRN